MQTFLYDSTTFALKLAASPDLCVQGGSEAPPSNSLALSECDYSDAGEAAQRFFYGAPTPTSISLASDPLVCVDLQNGCCSGEPVRGGAVAFLNGCSGSPTQAYLWPSPDYAPAPNAIATAANTTAHELVSPSAFPLVLDGAGLAYPGIPLAMHTFAGNITSAFLVNGSATPGGLGARLVHASTGLCITAGVSARDTPRRPLNLQRCDSARAAPGFFGSQLFSLSQGRIITSRGECVSAERPLGAANTIPGESRLVGAPCAPLLNGNRTSASQNLVLQADGRISAPYFGGGDLVADPGAGSWWGAPLALAASAASPTSAFTFVPAGGNLTTGTLVHAATGLCVDASGVPFGHGCLHPSVRGLPYCNASLDIDARVADLVSRMSPAELYTFTGAGEFDEPCSTVMPEIARLDVPMMRHLVEVTSMASSESSNPYGGASATSFAAGFTLAAAFNKSVWHAHGTIVGTEMRAFNNIAWCGSCPDNGNFITLSGWVGC